MSVDRLCVLKSICVVVSSVLLDDMFVVRTYVCVQTTSNQNLSESVCLDIMHDDIIDIYVEYIDR
jgi:hypothetical protein